MNLEQLLKRQEGLTAELTKGLQSKGLDAAILRRPVEVNQERAAALQARIEAIEQEKVAAIAWADEQVSALKAELARLGDAIKSAEAMMEPVLKAAKPGATKAATTKATTKSRSKGK